MDRECNGCGEAPCGCYIRTLEIDGVLRYLGPEHVRYHEAHRSFWERRRPRWYWRRNN